MSEYRLHTSTRFSVFNRTKNSLRALEKMEYILRTAEMIHTIRLLYRFPISNLSTICPTTSASYNMCDTSLETTTQTHIQ